MSGGTEGLRSRLDRLETLIFGPQQPTESELENLSTPHLLAILAMLMPDEELRGPGGEALGARIDGALACRGWTADDMPRIMDEAMATVQRWLAARRAWEEAYGPLPDEGATW